MKVSRHPNGYLYIRGNAPSGEAFYLSTKSKDENRARQIGELWINGKLPLGQRPDESRSLSELLLPTSQPLVSSFVSLPESISPSAVKERSNILDFPTMPESDQETRDAINAAMGIAPVIPITSQSTPKAIVKKDYSSLCEFLGSGVATMFVGCVAWGYRQLDREPGRPSDKQLKELGEAMGDQLKEWFTDADLKPWHRIAMVSLVIMVGMWLQGKPIPKPPKVSLMPPLAGEAKPVG